MKTEQFQLHADIEERHWWFVARRRIMQRMVRRVLPPSPDTTIVDVGCGTGANIASLADDYHSVGIDTSGEAIQWAQKRFPEVKFLVGRAPDELGPIAEKARMFVLMDVLEHVPDDFAMLSELLAAAQPDSYFLLTVPANESLWSRHDESFGHFRRYDQPRLERLWADLPVEALVVSHFNHRMYPLIRTVRACTWQRVQTWGRAGTHFWMPPGPVNRLLEAMFAGEAKVLEDLLDGRRSQGYRTGSSLLALVQRKPGPIAVRSKPDDVAPDRHRVAVAPCEPESGPAVVARTAENAPS
jgi:SAM-dependent methyltransferase